MTLTWLAGAAAMNRPQVQGALLILAGCALQAAPKRLLINEVELGAETALRDESMCDWWSREISPLCNDAGIEKLALLRMPYPNGQRRPKKAAERRQGENYSTREFNDSDACWEWLSG